MFTVLHPIFLFIKSSFLLKLTKNTHTALHPELLESSITMALPSSSLSSIDISSKASPKPSNIFVSRLRSSGTGQSRLRFLEPSIGYRRDTTLRLKASRESTGLTQEIVDNNPKLTEVTEKESDHFKKLRQRFIDFKKDKFLQNLEHYKSLSEVQTPKFMVIACGDSRVCPTSILGFQPGEAFVVRNVANLVPPHENGPSETNAALEFAVNSLEVENILVIGHSCCGGIKALMSLQDEVISSSFIRSWVVVGSPAKMKTKADASHLNFDQQCRHCEKESVNRSLLNLLSYPWIEDRVIKGTLSIHGGYYDFIDCTFEKWTLDYKGTSSNADGEHSIKDREFWS